MFLVKYKSLLVLKQTIQTCIINLKLKKKKLKLK